MEYDNSIMRLIGEYEYIDKYNNIHLSLDYRQINFDYMRDRKEKKELFMKSIKLLNNIEFNMKKFFNEKYNSPINNLSYKIKIRKKKYILSTENDKIINLKTDTKCIIIMTCKIVIYSFKTNKNTQIKGWRIELENIKELL